MSVETPITADKATLRSLFSEKRARLSDSEITHLSQVICAQILAQLPALPISIHLFLPLKRAHEVDLFPLLDALWHRGDCVYVPRVTNKRLDHIQITPQTIIKENHWGIPEPLQEYPPAETAQINNISHVITPLLVCDKQGFRVGYGGGFYDAFFQDYPHFEKIGVGFFPPISKITDTFEGDIALDKYITPEKITVF